MRSASAEDRGAVESIAREGFASTRFHLDPSFPQTFANEIKAQWAGNFFSGQRGDAMLVAEASDGAIAGFLQLLVRGPDLVIDLIAVSEKWRGKGVGGAMIEAAEAQFEQCSQYLVGTQLANAPSLRLYQSCGFSLKSGAYVFHFHLGAF